MGAAGSADVAPVLHNVELNPCPLIQALTRGRHTAAKTLDGFVPIRNTGMKLTLRNYKIPNGKLNVTVDKRPPVLNRLSTGRS